MVKINLENVSKTSFFICLTLLIFFSLLPGTKGDGVKIYNYYLGIREDYFKHLLAYAVTSASFVIWQFAKFKQGWQFALIFISSIISMSLILEIAQIPIPNRSFSYIDFMMNSLGVFSGIAIAYMFIFVKQQLKTF